MKDWTNATIEECCDFLAECKGFEYKHGSWWHPKIHGAIYHPIPPALDAIAGALPEGCWWSQIRVNHYGVCICVVMNDRVSYEVAGDTERLARARAACMAWEAQKGTA